MREHVVRLSGIRQGLGVAGLIVAALLLYQNLFSAPAIPNTHALLQAILGAAMLVWAAEEHARGIKLFTVSFLIAGLGCIATALYIFVRPLPI
jgi:hypothetical protein